MNLQLVLERYIEFFDKIFYSPEMRLVLSKTISIQEITVNDIIFELYLREPKDSDSYIHSLKFEKHNTENPMNYPISKNSDKFTMSSQMVCNGVLKYDKIIIPFTISSTYEDLEQFIFESSMKHSEIITYWDLVHHSVLRYLCLTRYISCNHTNDTLCIFSNTSTWHNTVRDKILDGII